MRRLCLVTCGVVLAAGPALADTPVWNWSGFYVGAHAGAAFGRMSNRLSITNDANNYFLPAAIPGVNATGTFVRQRSSPIGGGEVGFNLQWGAWVAGAELDFGYLGLRTNAGGDFRYTTDNFPYTLTTSVKALWMATARPRIGWAMGNGLLFVTGGLALTQLQYRQFFNEAAFTPNNQILSQTRLRVGWAVGAGYEYAIAPGWSLKASYLFAHFASTPTGRLTGANGNSPAAGFVDGASFSNRSRLDVHSARFGIVYRFTTGPF